MNPHPPPRSGLGRADLLRVLGIPDPARRESAVAALAAEAGVRTEPPVGFRPDPKPSVPPPSPEPEPPRAAAPPDAVPFLRAVAFAEFPSEASVADTVDGPDPLPADPLEGLPAAELVPLATAAEVIAAIRSCPASLRAGTEPDFDAAVTRIGRCQSIDPLPFRRRRAWGGEVLVLRDQSSRLTPYRADQFLAEEALAGHYPKAGVRVAANGSADFGFRGFGRGGRHGLPIPPPGVLVVLLGDLGCLAADGRTAAEDFWLRWGRRLIDNGNPAVALVPTFASAVSDPLRKVWTVVPWGTRPGPAAPDPETLFETLLAVVSNASRLEPGLLRALRGLLPECRSDPGWESRVWQHRLLDSRHHSAGTLNPAVQAEYLTHFARLDADLREAVRRVVTAWHYPARRLTWATSVLAAAAASGGRQPPDRWFALAADRVRQFARENGGTPYGLAARAWAADAVRRLWDGDVPPGPLKTALNRIHAAVRPPEGVVAVPRWVEAGFAAPAADADVTIAVDQRGDDLVFRRADGDAVGPEGRFAGSPLGTLRSRNGSIVLAEGDAPPDPFWASGRRPAWVSVCGDDPIGKWAELRVGDAVQRLRWIPPGQFRMGSPDDEKGRWEDEGPVHDVAITHGYWLFDTPCCQDLWEAVSGRDANKSRFDGPRRPVEEVSWDAAVAWIEALNARCPGLDLRLPREAEWEYACRAGSAGARYGPLDEVAWHTENSGGTTHDVGQKAANAWGLFDMLGNVWEWCGDLQRIYTSASVTDPVGESGDGRVVRGGSWLGDARSVRAAYRSWDSPGGRLGGLGFRCLSSGDEPSPAWSPRSGVGSGPAEPGSGAERSSPQARKLVFSVRDAVPVAVPAEGGFRLESDRERLVFGRLSKPGWAEAIGRDRYGLWAELRVGDAVQRLRWVPPGRFRMGSPEDEEGRYEDEGPVHDVTISRGYWLFDTPCCQDLFEAVLVPKANESRFRHPRRPVENVSWHRANEFIAELEKKVGLWLRLPKEAEWEYACRAGTTTATYAGPIRILGENNAPILDDIAWYGGNSGVAFDLEDGWDSRDWPNKQHEHSKAGTRIVGGKDANAFGLYDMLGNVREWCQDAKRPYTADATIDPDGGQSGDERVFRGGGWFGGARRVRAAYRYWHSPVDRSVNLGFRCLSSGVEEKEGKPVRAAAGGVERSKAASGASAGKPGNSVESTGPAKRRRKQK